MKEFRKKQARLKKIMNILCIFTGVYYFVYIGIEPTLAAASQMANIIVGYIGEILIIACLVILFMYFSRYGKSDKFLENIEYELSDIGFYYSSREESDVKSYTNAVIDDLKNNGYSINSNETINDFEFSFVCRKGKELFYIVNMDKVEKCDVIAYLDSAMYDVTSVNVKRKANAVVCFICSNADDEAIALSKAITALGKKEQIKLAISIVEVESKKSYFLGNKISKCQQMIANYVMNCDLPIKDKYKGEKRLPFQDELEKHMEDFNIKDYKNGTFYAHY